uniref:VP n=1 Tax=uncultured densovirus TaxID=748192 RepID=A0A7L7YTG1_9VIRU|nr:VP [uncultured densovirus]
MSRYSDKWFEDRGLERNTFDWLEDGAHFESNPERLEWQRPNYWEEPAGEAIELDEVEINESAPLLEESFSATPGLAEAGGVAGTAVGGTVGSGISVPGSILVGGGILGGIGAGTGIAISQSDSEPDSHIDPVVSLPGHRYIGPGNTVDSIEPVDSDDAIAKDHDIAYEHAKTQEDVQDADRVGAHEFLTDALFNQNPHSIAGYIGLKGKEKAESVIGVQYPPNLPSSAGTCNMSNLLSRSPRALAKYPVNRDPRKHPDFPKRSDHTPGVFRSRVAYIWDAWNRTRQNHGLPRVDPPRRLGIETTMRPPRQRDGTRRPNSSIAFHEWERRNSQQAGPLIDGFNRQRELGNAQNDHLLNTVVADDLSPNELAEVEDIIRQAEGGSISVADFDNRDGAGPSGSVSSTSSTTPPSTTQGNTTESAVMDTRGTKRQRVDGPTSTPAPASADGTGHNSASDGGFDSAQGPMSTLYKGGYRVEAGMMSFTKVHRIKCPAIPFWKIADTSRAGSILTATPLCELPWNRMYFYMSQEEFDLIPAGSYVKSCNMKVMQLVAQTGYPTGGTESSTATTNHPKILCYADDLEGKSRGVLTKKVTLNANMVPTAVTAPNPTDFILKQYGSTQSDADVDYVAAGCAYDIPFYTNNVACIYQPNRAQAKVRGFFTENTEDPPEITANYSVGQEVLRNMIVQINSNDTTWDSVVERSYNFNHAPIGEQFPVTEICTDEFNSTVGNMHNYNQQRVVTNTNINSDIDYDVNDVSSTRNTIPYVTYRSSTIEKGAYVAKSISSGKPSRQPSFHIGMRAIDKYDPLKNESRASTFVQANIEFCVQVTINIQLPAYPNRFLRPTRYTTTIENAILGNQRYPNDSGNNTLVTFGLYGDKSTAPTRDAVDDDSNKRPKRSLPATSVAPKPRVSPRRRN